MKQRLKCWMEETNDPGHESTAVYAVEMDYQIGKNKNNPAAYVTVKKNVEMYKRWANEKPFKPLD